MGTRARIRGSGIRNPPKVKQAKGSKNQMKKLNELKKVSKEIDDRFKVSEKLFIRKDKLKRELGIE